MGDFVSSILYFAFVILSSITSSENFRNLGIVSLIVTIIAITIGISSYYINAYEWNKIVNNDLFPDRYSMTEIEINRIKDRIYWSELRCLISFYCFISFGVVSTIFVVSIISSYIL